MSLSGFIQHASSFDLRSAARDSRSAARDNPQLHDVNGGAFDVEWIELGTATHDEIWKMVSEDKIKFTDIFDYERAAMVETPVLMSGGIEMQTTPTCPPGYTM